MNKDQIAIDDFFDYDPNDERSQVIEIFPQVFYDYRGKFGEVFKEDKQSEIWLQKDSSWIKQVNRSFSRPMVVRGFHMQKDPYCQGKLVQCISGNTIYDCIIDVRPWSKSFGQGKVYELSPNKGNQLWVPRGFLHGFMTGNELNEQSIFEYFCDNVYDKDSEISVNPLSVPNSVINFGTSFSYVNNLEFLLSKLKYKVGINEVILSTKDLDGENYLDFIEKIKQK